MSRTGKTTAINEVGEYFVQKGNRVKIYEETARIYLNNHQDPIDRQDMHKWIIQNEKERLNEISQLKEKNEFDIILIDRTFVDTIVYIYRNYLLGYLSDISIINELNTSVSLSNELYDDIVFFDEMIIQDDLFDDYNNPEMKAIFKYSIQKIYQQKIQHYPTTNTSKKYTKTYDKCRRFLGERNVFGYREINR
ncbi:TPA: hypothetical protein DEP21_03560 [Patescibacteria group bacterium]|nr:hypothetical protein [Candidatus Gracilibacteria bacterium]